MRLWTADIVALTAGWPAPGDTTPELAVPNAALTVTVGLGAGMFALTGSKPAGFDDLPVMRHDRLQAAWSGGDLLLLVGADDTVSVVTPYDGWWRTRFHSRDRLGGRPGSGTAPTPTANPSPAATSSARSTEPATQPGFTEDGWLAQSLLG